jgi:excinuclease UvrABC nuclease subunit
MTEFDPESYLAQLTTRPGVYQMFDQSGELALRW